jgi:hypothetical protein
MSSSVSPTTSIAADSREQQQCSARDVMNALLFCQILEPLAAGLGPVGEIALGTVADELFVRLKR